MHYEKKLKSILNEELPSLTLQKRKQYRPSMDEIISIYIILNNALFNNKLSLPKIELLKSPKRYFGECAALELLPKYKKKSNCVIRLAENWCCKQFFINILAHEMVHQYQWDIESKVRLCANLKPIISHGPSFFKHKRKFKKYNLSLKRTYSIENWYKYQNLLKI